MAVGYGVDVTHLSLFLLGRYYYCYPAPFIFANSFCAINSKEKKKQFPALLQQRLWPAPHWLGFPLTHASHVQICPSLLKTSPGAVVVACVLQFSGGDDDVDAGRFLIHHSKVRLGCCSVLRGSTISFSNI